MNITKDKNLEMILKYVLLTLLLIKQIYCKEKCKQIEALVTGNVENEGFHRNIKWLIEIDTKNATELNSCKIAIRQDIPNGLYTNPDQIADLIRVGKISAFIDGIVDVETPMHLSDPHIVYIFNQNNSNINKISLELPIHLRYQRAQITGGYGKIELPPSSLLIKCPNNIQLCGKHSKYTKVEAPCSYVSNKFCKWSNISYQDITNGIEMLVPIGDLDHYPLVSIVTLLVSCAGCIYILSVLSTMIL